MPHQQERFDRVAGALLGVHAGDSLGATLEFRSWDSIHAQYPAGLREIVGGKLKARLQLRDLL